MSLPGQSAFNRTVIDRFQDAHIERYGIGRVVSAFQISLVFCNQVCVQLVKQDLLVIYKAAETSECHRVGFRCAYLSQAFQSGYLLANIVVKRLPLFVSLKMQDYIIRHKYAGLG